MVRKQSNFSRQKANDAKMGAYYTDGHHCRRIGMLVDFPDGEVSILEPCIGDGAALHEVLSGNSGKAKVFAVELNERVYQEHIRDNPEVEFSLNADFLSGIRASHKSFGFCFANPPYGVDENGIRLEQRFAEKLYLYLKPGAPIALVIPHYVLVQERFLASFFSRFVPEMEFRFDDNVFQLFQQVVIIGTRREALESKRQEMQSYRERILEPEMLPYLPREKTEVKKRVSAVPSSADSVKEFFSLEFHAKEAGKRLAVSSLYEKAGQAFVPKYEAGDLNQPVVPPKPDILYLLAVCGRGQGLVGSEENSDVHLQRGVAKIVESARIEGAEGNSERMVEKVKTSTQVQLVIIENSGKITRLS